MTEGKIYKCLSCKRSCPEIFIYDVSDFIGEIWLRVCNKECFYELIHDFLCQTGTKYKFNAWLLERINEDDKKLHNELIQEGIENIKNMKLDKELFSKPFPHSILKTFKKANFPFNYGKSFKFKRPTEEEKIQYAKKYISDLESKIFFAKEDLAKLENIKLLQNPKDKSI